MLQSLLIANRGEIARRIIRTCRKMGIRSVAVYSEVDRGMPFVREADLAVHIGPAAVRDSYLHIEKIIEAAQRSGAQAIHPGYGFLAENADLARRCREAGLLFIGPRPDAIEAMGSKSRAKALMEEHGVPVIPGYRGKDQSKERFLEEADRIGYPVLLKASGGGGGKGMRIVSKPAELPAALEGAQREARKNFGDAEMLLEKYFPSARHIEFQIFGDKKGNAIHLLERECTIQRRYQKVMEESPSPALDPATRSRMGHDAVRVARALQYDNAGTVEFILTPEGKYYFLEVNTRLQVEHPVTEAITGLDLVEWQIRVAEGAPLPLGQDDIRADGYALELRLYAEDARNDFLPVTGQVVHWHSPELAGLRVDAAVESGSEIGIHYDPMIAKLIAHGPDRPRAFRRMQYALGAIRCLGLTTNLPFLQLLLRQPAVREGHYDTHFLERLEGLDTLYDFPSETIEQAAIGLTLYRWHRRGQDRNLLPALPSGWRNSFYQGQRESFRIVETDLELEYRCREDHFTFRIGDQDHSVRLLDAGHQVVQFELDGMRHCLEVYPEGDWYYLFLPGTGQLIARAHPRFPEVEKRTEPGSYDAPMPGEILKVLVRPGDEVQPGDPLLILSSMKMENTISATEAGRIAEVFVEAGQQVTAGLMLLRAEPQTQIEEA